MIAYFLLAMLTVFAVGGTAFAFVGSGSDKAKKRIVAVAKPRAALVGIKGNADANQQRRKNVQVMLKELEKQNVARKKRPSLRRRIEQAGLQITPRQYWIGSGVAGVFIACVVLLTGQNLIVVGLSGFATGLGFPRWILSFLKGRREKAFTHEFAPAIDVIVRSVKTGLPVTEALKVVASEIPEPVAGEFKTLNDGLKVGVTMDQGLKRMFERMPTAEVNFFGIVMTIQQKSGGNLSEALQNLSSVLRDRKRLRGKIRAMSSEAKASAVIIGSLPPIVMILIYMTSPDYISVLFTTQLGKLLLVGCVVWMSVGIFFMKKMVNLKF